MSDWATEHQTQAHILLVDDYTEVRQTLLRHLLQAGYLRAYSLRTAFEAVALCPVDLVLMDVSLAGDDVYANGCDAVLDIQARWPTTRTALLTGWDPVTLPANCPRDMPLILKPFMSQVFLAKIAELLLAPPWRPNAGHP